MGNLQAEPEILAMLGHIALLEADTTTAAEYLHSSLSGYRHIYRQLNFTPQGGAAFVRTTLIDTLLGTAVLAAGNNEFERAAALMGQVNVLREHDSQIPEAALHALGEAAVGDVRAKLGEVAFKAAWEQGRALLLDNALGFALGEG
jgi:hypothetical protein